MSSPAEEVEFFFDFSSPWTYMAFVQVLEFRNAHGIHIRWRPFYVAAVFRAINHHVSEMRSRPVPAKLEYYKTDMKRWADRLGIRIARPPVYGGGSAPLNSARALRGALVAIEHGCIEAYAGRVFRAYWEDLRDVSQPAVLAEIAAAVGMEPAAFEARCDSEPIRDALRAATDEFVARGGFGTPTVFVGSEMYFGNDRLDFVIEALEGGRRART